MKRTIRRYVSIVVCLMLLLSLLPLGTMAVQTDAEQILTEAYALPEGATLDYEATLTGVITEILTPYDSNYKNITVEMAVPGYEHMPIVCYRMKGDGVDTLQVGDTITVAGQITRYVKTDIDTGEVITDQVEFAMPQLLSVGGREMTRLYCNAPEYWDRCYIYWWGGSVECPSWPGIALEIDPAGIWRGSVPSDAEGFVFNNYYDTNTDELVVPTDGYNQYNVQHKLWTAYGDEPQGNVSPDSLALVGSGFPGIAEWDPADPAGHMQEVSQGIYVKTLEIPAACEIEFKIVGNDTWDGLWVFGGGAIQLGEWSRLERGSGAENLHLTVEESCTLSFTIDLNGLRDGDYAYLLVETDTPPVPQRRLIVYAPDFWPGVYAYTWDPESFGSWPGSPLRSHIIYWEMSIPSTLVNLVLSSGMLPDMTRYQTPDITVTPGTNDVTVSIRDDGMYTLQYGNAYLDRYRVVGNASWMGDWFAGSDAGLMEEIGNNVYQKCFKNVTPGSYEFRITTDGTWDESIGDSNGNNFCFDVETPCDVTVTLTLVDGATTVDVQLDYPGMMGDVTGDGQINLGDVSQLYAHVRGSKLMGAEGLLCADFNDDGDVNMGDISGIYAYVRGTDSKSAVDTAYGLEFNKELPQDRTVTGTVIDVLEPYNAQNGSITVRIAVAGRENMPIICSRLIGDDVQNMDVGDEIKVTGTLRNFYGTVEFKEGCRLVKWTDVPSAEEKMAAIVDAAYALADNETMDHAETLTGTVISMEQAYTPGLPYISVTMEVAGREDKPIFCYRMVGDDIAMVDAGDIITVIGTLRNFHGTVEFEAGCLLECWEPGATDVPVETDPKEIVDLAYTLGVDDQLPYDVTLRGKVSAVLDAYNPEYENITVELQVPGREHMPITLYRLMGEGVDRIACGDTVVVTGRLQNYNGTIEMINGMMLDRISGGGQPVEVLTDPAEIMDAALHLSDNEELPYDVTLTGQVLEINEAYDDVYQSMTVTISVQGTDCTLMLYRLKGDDAQNIAVNDTVTVSGRIKMYYSQPELVNGMLINRISGGGMPPVVESEAKAIVDAAYALAEGDQLPYEVTLTGKIMALRTPYDPRYMNMTVVMAVEGREDKPIECYRVRGENVGNHLCVGDIITVTGILKNYWGTIEFDTGCQMTDYQPGTVTKPTDPKQIVDAAFALGENEVLPYFATLTGTVKSIDQEYNENYKNVTVTMTVQGTDGPKDIVCYRLKGDSAADVAVGNTITVTGAIKRSVREKDGVREDFVEFDSGCILESPQR